VEPSARYARIVQTLNECPGSPERWQQLLIELATIFGCSFAGFVRWHRAENSQIGLSHGLDESALAAYHQYYAAINPWIKAASLLADTAPVVPTEALVPDRVFTESEFFNDFVQPNRGRHGVSAHIAGGEYALHLSLVRDGRKGSFSTGELRTAERLVPHLRSALALDRSAAVLRAEAAAAVDYLDALPVAIVLLLAKPFANKAARDLVAAHRDVFLMAGHTIHLQHAAWDRELQRRIAQARNWAQAAVDLPVTIEISAGIAFRLSVIGGLSGTGWPRSRPPVVMIERVVPKHALKTGLARDYGLTRREIDVLLELHAGTRLRDVADRLHIAVATARRHLVHVFRKTGSSSQSQVIRLVDRARTVYAESSAAD
jgi:DNA-binding CsgD family transcriptional regulator